MVIGKDGKRTIRKGKKYFFVCDTGLGSKKLKQTMLSFFNTTPVSGDNSPSVADNNSDNLNKGERFGDFVENTTHSRGKDQGRTRILQLLLDASVLAHPMTPYLLNWGV